MRKLLLAGNWKMHKTNPELGPFFSEFAAAVRLKEGQPLGNVEILFAVPFTLLAQAQSLAKRWGIKIAAQNVHFEPEGAFTGEISIPMLKDIGISAAVVGHSERRQYFGDDDQAVAKKVRACLAHGITPIACVGETKEQRLAGKTQSVISSQLVAIIQHITDPQDLVIAYEPIWAIGTGLTATSAQAQEVHHNIRFLLKEHFGQDVGEGLRILYGGSAKPENIGGLLAEPDIDGGLVGGASLKAQDFAKMVTTAMHLSQ